MWGWEWGVGVGGWDEGRCETDIMETAALLWGKQACEDTIDRLTVTRRHTEAQRHRHTDRQADRHTDTQTHTPCTHTHRQRQTQIQSD